MMEDSRCLVERRKVLAEVEQRLGDLDQINFIEPDARGPVWVIPWDSILHTLRGMELEPLDARLLAEDDTQALADVRAERARHSEIGYDEAHDDRHQVHHLVAWADRYAHMPSKSGDAAHYDRYRLVQAASLLLAAIEWMDRQDGVS